MAKLTKTELRIASLAARGQTNQEIATRLLISPKTVEWNLTKVYRKLRVRSRTELAVKFLRPGRAEAKSGDSPGRALPRSAGEEAT